MNAFMCDICKEFAPMKDKEFEVYVYRAREGITIQFLEFKKDVCKRCSHKIVEFFKV